MSTSEIHNSQLPLSYPEGHWISRSFNYPAKSNPRPRIPPGLRTRKTLFQYNLPTGADTSPHSLNPNMHITIGLNTPSETIFPVSRAVCHGPSTGQPLAPEPEPEVKRHLYFAYGSNLSPTQMKKRCTINPTLSSKPLAIAILPKWRWLICEAGYANVLPPPRMRVGAQDSDIARKIPKSGKEDTVYGILYEMDAGDELILDGYEGVDHQADEADGDKLGLDIRPREQGEGDYNKWYLPAEVVEWIGGDDHPLKTEKGGLVPTLVYVDEERVVLGPPTAEYIPRMNRAIRESEALGVPGDWLEEVLRRFIPKQ